MLLFLIAVSRVKCKYVLAFYRQVKRETQKIDSYVRLKFVREV